MLKEIYTNINAQIFMGREELKKLLKRNGGFLMTDEKSGDKIFGYDMIDDTIVERRITAIRLTKDGDIEVYCEDVNSTRIVSAWGADDTYETFLDGDSNGYWVSLFHSEMYGVFTLYNILENIR